MADYKAIYKCRLCGQVFHKIIADQNLATTHIKELAAGIVPRRIPVRIHQTHYCGGSYAGGLGLADFQGWRATPPLGAEDKTESGLLEEG